MAKLAELYTELTGRDAGLSAKLTQVHGQLGHIGGALSGLGPLFVKAFAAAGAFFGGRAMIRAAMEGEDAFLSLSSALETMGTGGAREAERFRDLASEIQKLTTLGDEEIMGLMKLATNFGVTSDKIEETTRGAIGLARAVGVDASSAIRYLVMAQNGEYEALGRLIPQLRGIKSEHEAMARIQKLTAAGWQQEQAATQTLSGSWAQLKNELGDLGEALATEVLPFVKDFVILSKEAIAATREWAEKVRPLTTSLRELFGISGGRMERLVPGGIGEWLRQRPEPAPAGASAGQTGPRAGQLDPRIVQRGEVFGRAGGFVGIADLGKQLQQAMWEQEEKRLAGDRNATLKRQEALLQQIRDKTGAQGLMIVPG